jgi:hypothetical protein
MTATDLPRCRIPFDPEMGKRTGHAHKHPRRQMPVAAIYHSGTRGRLPCPERISERTSLRQIPSVQNFVDMMEQCIKPLHSRGYEFSEPELTTSKPKPSFEIHHRPPFVILLSLFTPVYTRDQKCTRDASPHTSPSSISLLQRFCSP